MAKEEQIIAASIKDSRRNAQHYEDELSQIQEGQGSIEDSEAAEEEIETTFFILAAYTERMLHDTAILAERLALPQYSQRVWAEIAAFEKSGFVDMRPTPFDIRLTSKPLARARELARPLLSIVDETAVTGLSVFEAILRNTPAIIHDRSLVPRNENDVQKAVFAALRYALPDMQREVSLGQVLKTYKPDFGSRAIAAAAEYKYVNSETELRKAVGGIYEDMKGYSGHYEWRRFYAVLYLTSPIANVARIEAEFSYVDAETSWQPIVVHGTGQRSGNGNLGTGKRRSK